MSDAPVSKIDVLPAFEAAVLTDKAKEMLRAAIAVNNVTDLTAVIRKSPVTPQTLHDMFVSINEQASVAVATILGAGGDLGTQSDLRATVLQGDYCCRAKRAATLRHASRVRRSVHAMTRRSSHGMLGGYLDRRVKDPVVDILRAGKA